MQWFLFIDTDITRDSVCNGSMWHVTTLKHVTIYNTATHSLLENVTHPHASFFAAWKVALLQHALKQVELFLQHFTLDVLHCCTWQVAVLHVTCCSVARDILQRYTQHIAVLHMTCCGVALYIFQCYDTRDMLATSDTTHNPVITF